MSDVCGEPESISPEWLIARLDAAGATDGATVTERTGALLQAAHAATLPASSTRIGDRLDADIAWCMAGTASRPRRRRGHPSPDRQTEKLVGRLSTCLQGYGDLMVETNG